jgi:hypothetical protein
MTTRSIHLCLAALTLACGPSEATTTDADDTSGTTLAETTTDEGVDPDDTTTSLDPDTSADLDTSESSSTTDDASEETTAASSESGGGASSDGRFELSALGAVVEPAGCAAQGGPAQSAWTIEFTLPAGDGEFAMVETFGPYVSDFSCTLADDAFTCARETIVDYSRFSGMDALVHHASAYEVGWDDDGLVGTYTADFGCEGDECASILEEWQLTAFPCGVQVPFQGVLARGQ